MTLRRESVAELQAAGWAAFQRGEKLQALCMLELSVALPEADAFAHCNLGVVLEAAGRATEAIAQYRRSVELDPALYESHLKLAHALARGGETAEACVALGTAARLRPRLAAPVNDLGVLLARMGRHEPAAVCYQRAIALDATCAGAHGNLAAALCELGRFAEAAASASRALELQPDSLEFLLNLGNAYKEQGRLAHAAACYEEATELGVAEIDSGRDANEDARPWINLGDARREQGRIAEAAACYERAIVVQKDHPVAWSNRLYLHAFCRDVSPAEELALARGWEQAMLTEAERRAAREASTAGGGVFASGLNGLQTGQTRANGTEASRKLRLGILSAELGSHAVAEFLQPFLEHLDRERFHLTLLPTTVRTDERAAAIRSLADEYVPLTGLSDEDAVTLIRGRGIDLLIDSSGHTAGNRLGVFARRAAPVQLTWIGYWSTTGLTEMDYALADGVAPKGAEKHFSERLWRLERVNVCYRGDASLAMDWRTDPKGTVWLGSLNKFAKIREESITLWAGALRALPEAKLLLEDRGSDETESHDRIRREFARHDIATERIEFIPYEPGHERHMLLYNRLDIALDTVPFNSGTTAFDALWMGVPLVTIKGDWTGGRIAEALLREMGRTEWVAGSPEEFAETVQALAHDVEARRAMRRAQRERMAASSLCDATGLARAVEEALTSMYERWLAGER